ncbi:hypothetical protein DY000_02006792 [Brassica cretica]|uniref:Uncharacterized protein n=1 Tax=Brassica cretica TaxID=69181 RepID=A0ABQ7CLA9_BRACR|nr:hypothetical protein DY000_02006792 [Brassica cretica]
MVQYMEPGQDGAQDDQIIPTEVQAADRSRQTDRTVYRINPRASGKELRLEPRPDDRTDRTGARLPRPTLQAKTDGQARTHFDRVETETDHSLSLLVRLIRAECPDERTDGSASQYDQFLNFDDQNFSKARILQLSRDLGRGGTKLAHEPYPANRPERATPVLLLTAKEPLGSDEPGHQADQSGLVPAHLSRPTRQAKTNGQARINLARANSDSDHGFSLLARLARTACTGDHADDLSTLFDPIMDFSFGYFSKARILKLSEDFGSVGTPLVRLERPAALAERPAALVDRPAYVVILTALDIASSDASGQDPNGHLD